MATISFPWNKIKRSELQIGDHIYSFRNLYMYSHQGIYVGEDKVIHFSRTEEENPPKWESSNGTSPELHCKKCGYRRNSERGVIKTCLDCFLKGNSDIFLFKYHVSSFRFCMETPGTCSTGDCDEPNVVVGRAEEMLRANGFGNYDLWENNCECFAVYCKTGKRLSVQATYLLASADVGFRGIRRGISPVNVAKTYLKVLIVPKCEALQRDKMVHRQT